MYFIAAIKQQRGYDADEKAETKSKWNGVIIGEVNFTSDFNNSGLNFPEVESVTRFSSHLTIRDYLLWSLSVFETIVMWCPPLPSDTRQSSATT
jgi:hypothetical protein